MDVFKELFDAAMGQAGIGGWASAIGVMGVVVLYSLRIFRMAIVQQIVPKRYRWERLTPFAKFTLPFIVAAAGTLLLGVAANVAAGVALGSVMGKLIGAALAAGMAAIAAHKGTQNAGVTMDMHMLARDPDYRPGAMRKISSIAVPVDLHKARKRLAEIKKAKEAA